MTLDAIARFRRFSRAVTLEVGALDASYLGLGRPLGPARLLNAIGREGADVSTLREGLKLDSGLLSRWLRGLESEGLVEVVADAHDARRRLARLTDAGRRECERYEDLSNTRSREILSRHPHTETLLSAMDLVANALNAETIAIVETDPRVPDARHCLTAYYGELARRIEGGFEVKLSRDPEATDMLRPRGAFFVAMSDGLPLGCVGLKGRDGAWAEIKRLWVAETARGLGLARRLMAAAEDAARELGVGTLRLDTNSALPEAASLYRKSGWRQIERFNDDPYPNLFFEKEL